MGYAQEMCDVCQVVPPVCGDGTCDAEETCLDCPDDCGACPPPADCCSPKDTPGCEDPTCEAIICGQDEFCCTAVWDNVCSEGALELCGTCGGMGAECGDGACDGSESCVICPDDCGTCPPNDCCAATPIATSGCADEACETVVCAGDPFCCDAAWDANCAATAAESCAACGGTPPATDCCYASGGLGCETPECEAVVCAFADWCCDTAWDQDCADLATLYCPACTCGDGVCESLTEDCESCPADCGTCPGADCCVGQASPGCGDTECEQILCSTQPYCCDTMWDTYCATSANELCPVCGGTPPSPVCGDGICAYDETCYDCSADCGTCSSDCCQPNATAGCDDASCSAQVCGLASWCCSTSWDDQCAAIAGMLCPVCIGSYCGDGLCDATAGEDCSTCPGDCEPCAVDDCCVGHGYAGCGDDACEASVCAVDASCCSVIWDNSCAAWAAFNCPQCF